MTGEGVGFMAYRQKNRKFGPNLLCPSLNVIKYFLCWALLPSAADAGKHLEMKSNSLWSCWWLGLGWCGRHQRTERGDNGSFNSGGSGSSPQAALVFSQITKP